MFWRGMPTVLWFRGFLITTFTMVRGALYVKSRGASTVNHWFKNVLVESAHRQTIFKLKTTSMLIDFVTFSLLTTINNKYFRADKKVWIHKDQTFKFDFFLKENQLLALFSNRSIELFRKRDNNISLWFWFGLCEKRGLCFRFGLWLYALVVVGLELFYKYFEIFPYNSIVECRFCKPVISVQIWVGDFLFCDFLPTVGSVISNHPISVQIRKVAPFFSTSGSSNGKTLVSKTCNLGSIPSPLASK